VTVEAALPTTRPKPEPLTRDRDFVLLWFGRAVSDLGSAVSMVALPLVAVLVLDATTFQVTLVAAASALIGAALALPLGGAVEYRPKRPVMILADLVRGAALASVPLAAAAGVLTLAQLCAVAMVTATLTIVFGAASQAHLKSLVGRERLAEANGRLESTLWFGNLVGPPVAGVLVGAIGAAAALIADAVSFFVSAIAVGRIRRPEPQPPVRTAVSRRADLTEGWRFLIGHPELRRCLASYALFSGTVMLLSPLETVFLLRDVHAEPWQYGLAMGLPCAAGLVGARLAPGLIGRWGAVRAMRLAAAARGPWMLLFPLAPVGGWGVAVAAVTFAGLLGTAAVHNTALTTFRQTETPDDVIARSTTAWSAVVRVGQLLFILGGGLLAQALGVRVGLWTGAVLLILSGLLLPTSGRAPAGR